jgi:hypothetical protein
MLKRIAILATLAVSIAACAGTAGAPSPSAAPSTPQPTPTAVPGAGGVDPGNGGGIGGGIGGGGSTGSGGSGIGGGGVIPPGGGNDPLLGQATTVTPVAGLRDQRPVNVQLIRAVTDDQGVRVELRWWSGVAPCNALDSVKVDKDEGGKSIKLTVIEGSAPGDMACIDIAQLKATVVDLGKLAAGTWQIAAQGDAKPISVEVG